MADPPFFYAKPKNTARAACGWARPRRAAFDGLDLPPGRAPSTLELGPVDDCLGFAGKRLYALLFIHAHFTPSGFKRATLRVG